MDFNEERRWRSQEGTLTVTRIVMYTNIARLLIDVTSSRHAKLPLISLGYAEPTMARSPRGLAARSLLHQSQTRRSNGTNWDSITPQSARSLLPVSSGF